MKENPKGRLTIIAIASATIVLAGIAIFTGIKIFQTRKESVSPAAPQAEPLAQAPTSTPTSSPTPLAQSQTSPTTTPTPTRTASASATLTPTRKITNSPTQAAETLSDSGVSYPTILGITFGILLLVASFLLAL